MSLRRKALVVVDSQHTAQTSREDREALAVLEMRTDDTQQTLHNTRTSNVKSNQHNESNKSSWRAPWRWSLALDGSFLDADWFNLIMGFVVIMNAVEIGVQTDDLNKDRIIYTILDNLFLITYLT